MDSVTREELLRMLFSGKRQPNNPERRLLLPTVDEVEKTLSPQDAKAFATRRKALFADFMGLRDRISGLSTEEFCRHQLLNMLFGDGVGTVGDCWQRVVATRGDESLPTYEAVLGQLLQTGCVWVIDPE